MPQRGGGQGEEEGEGWTVQGATSLEGGLAAGCRPFSEGMTMTTGATRWAGGRGGGGEEGQLLLRMLLAAHSLTGSR